ncbi:MAG: hypothetical protein OEY48_07055, partial [Gammaproteobacteria bacterium]|nr:hypothetical protein [Gammaproteobacteria bacterium]
MFYRLVIKLIGRINQPLMHKFAYLYSYMFCKLCHFLPLKFSLPMSPVEVMGLCLSNPIGLAGGFDRQGKFLRYSDITGFGFIEVGTVNVEPNYQAIEFIQNLEKASQQFSNADNRQRWGINLGSHRNSLDKHAVADYTKGMELFWCHVDYLVINLSRPGSPVRALKPDLKELANFLSEIQHHHRQLALAKGHSIPIVVKIAIDPVNNELLNDLLLLIKEQDFDGVILAFENWPDSKAIITYLHTIKTVVDSLPLIVVGGVRTMADAK